MISLILPYELWNCWWWDSIPDPGWWISSMVSTSPPLSEQLLSAKTKPIDTHLAFSLYFIFVNLSFPVLSTSLSTTSLNNWRLRSKNLIFLTPKVAGLWTPLKFKQSGISPLWPPEMYNRFFDPGPQFPLSVLRFLSQ